MSLQDQDDELQLIRLLQKYARVRRASIQVYFDQAPPGMSGRRQFGQVKAVFVQEQSTADDAIMAHLRHLGARARNVMVVSSDRQVQQAARAVHAVVTTSEAFASQLLSTPEKHSPEEPDDRPLDESEIEEWEAVFRDGRSSPDQPT